MSLLTIAIGHATFCIVVVCNNVIARLRRLSGSLYEASADLGAHGWFGFRTITLPMLSTALLSGALLAFALSFDEVIRLGQQLPEVNVVVALMLVLTVIPVGIAARRTGRGGVARASGATATSAAAAAGTAA